MEELQAKEAERRAYFDNLFWKNVQKEATGEPTELTRPGVSNMVSRATALAAREGLLSDRKTMEIFVRGLERFMLIGHTESNQKQADRLLNELRTSQGKPPVVPTPPQTPQPAAEIKGRSINPLKMFRRKS